MAKETTRNIRLGLMVTVGLTLLIAALYFIGSKQNLFGSTIKLTAHFTDVSGLTVGNNVRYVGIDVGTVSDIVILNDSTVKVEMRIKSSATEFIRTSAIASIGTDGLMGNRLISINAVPGDAPYIEEGSMIRSLSPLDKDEIMRTLSQTNTEMYLISKSLREITTKIEGEDMLWNLLGDTTIAKNIRISMENVENSTAEFSTLIESFNKMSVDVQSGEGLMGTLLYDTLIIDKVERAMSNLQRASDSLNSITKEVSAITRHVKSGEGAAGTLLMDKEFDQNLNETMDNIKKASKSLEENMEALRSNFLFRRYFIKQEKDAAPEP